jgi:DedD protein
MNAGPHDRDDDFLTHEPPALQRLHGHERDREITLSMGVILSIFFALVLVCALFFGMGYTMGRHSSQSQTLADGGSSDSGNFSSFKPSPQSVAVAPVPVSTAPTVPSAGSADDATTTGADSATASPVATTPVSTASPATPVMPSSPKLGTTAPPPAPTQAMQQLSIVQVAAVSHQEDADVLLSALKKQGYSVVERPDPQDKLIHIQLGPFTNRNDANAMRQRLLADGYNAIVK